MCDDKSIGQDLYLVKTKSKKTQNYEQVGDTFAMRPKDPTVKLESIDNMHHDYQYICE